MGDMQGEIKRFILSCDLGQAQDPTAIATIEWVSARWVFTDEGHQAVSVPEDQITYRVTHLERLPLNTSYPKVIERIITLRDNIPVARAGSLQIAVDATGVGRAVVDMMRREYLDPIAISITAGENVNYEGDYVHVPKRDLVSAMQVLMQQKRLKVAKGLHDATTLVKELQNFRYKITQAGNDSYAAWREGVHDDLVLAVAIGCWVARQGVPDKVIW